MSILHADGNRIQLTADLYDEITKSIQLVKDNTALCMTPTHDGEWRVKLLQHDAATIQTEASHDRTNVALAEFVVAVHKKRVLWATHATAMLAFTDFGIHPKVQQLTLHERS